MSSISREHAAEGRASLRIVDKSKEKGWISSVTSVGGSSGQWEPFAARFEVPGGTSHLQVYVHSYSNAVVEAYLGNLAIVPVE